MTWTWSLFLKKMTCYVFIFSDKMQRMLQLVDTDKGRVFHAQNTAYPFFSFQF